MPPADVELDGVLPSPPVFVRACSSPADCDMVAAMCASSFPEEAASQGLSVQQWSQIEAEDLKATPSWWRQIGLACEGDTLLGVVVLTVENEADDSISWGEYSRRVGCGPTILSMLYDRVLDEALLEHECLIDFIAVSPDARGKGVGTKLMQWAEQTGAEILAETEADAVAAHGVEMTLWVATDNTVAVRLYERSGYKQVKRTDTGACRCMASSVLNWFLGHPVWIKMSKALPAPPQLAAAWPAQQTIQVAVPAGGSCAATAAPSQGAAVAADAQFETVPLDAPAAAAAVPSCPSSPGGSLMRKLSRGLFGAAVAAPAGEPPRSHSSAAAGARPGSSQSTTPRIAALGSGLPAGAAVELAQRGSGGRLERKGSSGEASSSIPLYAPGPLVEEEPLQKRLTRQLQLGTAAVADITASAASAASTSVVSLPLDSDSEEEVGAAAAAAYNAAGAAAGAGAARCDEFELVALSGNSVVSVPAAAPAPTSAD